MKKSALILFLAACTVFSLSMITGAVQPSASGASPETSFSDVNPDAWYGEAVEYCRERGIFTGTSDTTFSPSGVLSRAMLATVLYRLAESPSLEDENLGYPFADVPGDSWYADGIYWARLEGIMDGYGNNIFGPADAVTREQAVTILWRHAGSETPAGDFSDGAAVSDWASAAAGWALKAGLLTGWADNDFQPQSALTRAEAAVLLFRYLEGEGSASSGLGFEA